MVGCEGRNFQGLFLVSSIIAKAKPVLYPAIDEAPKGAESIRSLDTITQV